MARRTIKELEAELQEIRASADEWARKYWELYRQVQEEAKQTAAYKEIIRQEQAERKLTEITNAEYVKATGKIRQQEYEIKRLYEDNKRLLEGYRPGCIPAAGQDQAQTDHLTAINEKLQGEKEALQCQVRELISLLAQDQPATTKRLLEIPNAPKRGRRRRIDTETRAYIHELAKVTDGSGQKVNSLQSIATITGVSKTQVYTILQEPAPAGKWYSLDGSGRHYFADYREAIRSGKSIYFEEEGE